MVKATGKRLAKQVETRTLEIGKQLWGLLKHRRPSVFDRQWWRNQVMEWAAADPTVKVQMFRFVDVLPALRSHESVTRHLQEYYDEVRALIPTAGRMVMSLSTPESLTGRALAYMARVNAHKMAASFIAGANADDVLKSITKLRKSGLAFTLDLLGEVVVSEREADAYMQAYVDLIGKLAPHVNQWPEHPVLDRIEDTWIPKLQVSLKLSALYSQFRAVDPVGTAAAVKERLRPILQAARKQDAFVHIDMEHYAYKNLTLRIVREVLSEPEFQDWPDCGVVIQTYLPDAEDDLKSLLKWVKSRGTPIWIRLVKGAYWDYETILAEYRGWESPVYQEKHESDANFERQTAFLMKNRNWLRPAIASHNLRSLAHAIAWSECLEVPQNAWELQMLYGMAEEQQQTFAERGHRVRVYTPFGELLPGMAYLVRRLLENTSNDSFLRHAYDPDVDIDELLADPKTL